MVFFQWGCGNQLWGWQQVGNQVDDKVGDGEGVEKVDDGIECCGVVVVVENGIELGVEEYGEGGKKVVEQC